MTMQTKIIGRMPTDHGPYVSGQAYGKKFLVELYGCVWESKHDNNNTAPATLNTQAGTITPNTTDWKKVTGSTDQWLIDNGYKPVSASNVMDGNHTQHDINSAIVTEIGDDSTPASVKGRIKTLEAAVGNGGSVDSRIEDAKSEIKGNATSSCDTLGEAEALISTETTRAHAAEATLQNAIGALTQSNIKVVADHTQVQDPDATTIYREYGESSYADWMYQNGSWQKMAEYDNAVDDEPVRDSNNLAKSSGIRAAIDKYDEVLDGVIVGCQSKSNGVTWNYSKQSLLFDPDKKYRITCVSTGGSSSGRIQFYIAKGPNDVYSAGFDEGESKDIENKDGDTVGFYSTSGDPEKKVIFRVVNLTDNVYEEIKKEVGEAVEELNSDILDAAGNSYRFSYNFVVGSAREKRISVNVKKGETLLLSSLGSTAVGQFQLILLDHNGDDVISVPVDFGRDASFVMPCDIGEIRLYASSSSVTSAGVGNFEIIRYRKQSELKTLSSNIIFSNDCKHVCGNASYLYEDILKVDAKPGMEFFFHCDSYIGSANSSPFVAYFLNNNDEEVAQPIYFGEDKLITIPSSCTKILFTLYPRRSASDTSYMDSVFYGIVIARGTGVRHKLLGDLCKTDEIPEYYFNTVDNLAYMTSKLARIKSLISSGYTTDFFIIADTHWEHNERKSIPLLAYLKEHTRIKKLVHLGDVYNSTPNNYGFIDAVYDIFDQKDVDVVFGNHEYQSSTNKYELANMYNTENVLYDGSKNDHYYFYDDNFNKVRFIILGAYTNANEQNVAQNGYTQEQIDWIANKALVGVPSGYDIVVCTHKTCEINQNTDQLGDKDVAVTNVFDNYKSNNPNSHIVIFMGHTHRDRMYYTTGGIPVVIVTCDKNVPWPSQSAIEDPESPYYGWNQDIDVDRTSGTLREQAFDVCMINREIHNLILVRIGGKARDGIGNDPGNEVEERTVNF